MRSKRSENWWGKVKNFIQATMEYLQDTPENRAMMMRDLLVQQFIEDNKLLLTSYHFKRTQKPITDNLGDQFWPYLVTANDYSIMLKVIFNREQGLRVTHMSGFSEQVFIKKFGDSLQQSIEFPINTPFRLT